MDEPMVTPDFDKSEGLIPAIAQDESTGEVLMLAYMNRDAWEMTLKTGKATYYSRSRRKLWIKGGTSGHLQLVREIRIDCDADTVLVKVEQLGGIACHTGRHNCFFRELRNGEWVEIAPVLKDPNAIYKKSQ